ncbi:MAG: exopolysaccharide biosynthesis polyprenyl glycosylphosphotransferase [Proteobacteria bacterium]|nr:exopolysaccharide biosynthesis polyprenyl glycosylphosphotransferase [Pseudomonadota bacterium]
MVISGIPIGVRQLVLLAGDTLCLLLAAYLGHFLRFSLSGRETYAIAEILESTTGATTFFVLVHLLFLYLADGYDARHDFRQPRQLVRLWLAIGAAFVSLFAVSYAAPFWAWGRGVALGSFLGFAGLLTLWRATIALVGPRAPSRLTAIVGGGAEAEPLRALISGRPDLLADTRFVAENVGLDELERVPALVSKGVSQVVVAARSPLPKGWYERLISLKAQGVHVVDIGSFIASRTGRLPSHSIEAPFMVYSPGFEERAGVARTVARTLDVAIALTGLVLSLPLLLGGMLAVRLTSPGPIFYSQERIGQYEKPYQIYKIRTMSVDAESSSGPVWSQGPGDPRVTPAGRFLRRTRIDELPQFFNVLRGDMSMVGPRPEREPFVSELREAIPYYELRFAVKPGVTGWAQVSYGYGATVDDSRVKLEYELYAIQNMTPALYGLILLKTLQTVLVRPGS